MNTVESLSFASKNKKKYDTVVFQDGKFEKANHKKTP